jgi:rhamnogalacturonyl hydrolase YesR
MLLLLLASAIPSALGVRPDGSSMECRLTPDDLDFHTSKTRVLIVGAAPDTSRAPGAVAVSIVPSPAPETAYPPSGDYYGGASHQEAAYLWRWIGMHAPDLVVDVRSAGPRGWWVPEGSPLARLPGVRTFPPAQDLVSRLTPGIPALRVQDDPDFLPRLLAALRKSGFRGPSPARLEMQRRLARSPLEVARQLAVVYGYDLNEAVYIPAVALLGRLRLGETADVERIVEPYFSGARPSLPPKPTGSHLSGHLVFGELYRLTSKPRYLELVRAAANLGFDERGAPLPAMPYHNEMSDAVFMGCPILAQAGRLTGETKYYDQALRHMKFMLDLNLRPDGLHRHSPLDSTAWGRGNGFPALGLALSLSDLPAAHPGRDDMLRAFRAHLEALAKHQDSIGAWRQVIDHPGSYRELTATCMIGFAMLRGVRSGWLDRARFQPLIDRAWYAARTRIAPNGDLVDVCTGTGKQRSLRDYLDRTAIFGRDPRGGAMALLFATELAGLTGFAQVRQARNPASTPAPQGRSPGLTADR